MCHGFRKRGEDRADARINNGSWEIMYSDCGLERRFYKLNGGDRG